MFRKSGCFSRDPNQPKAYCHDCHPFPDFPAKPRLVTMQQANTARNKSLIGSVEVEPQTYHEGYMYKVGPEPIVINGVMGPFEMAENKWNLGLLHPHK